MENEKRLYFIIHPLGALVGSQLNPQDFATHYKFGSAKHFEGKFIFAEIDINYRNPYFDLDGALKDLVPHADGRPKATKFIKTYRVLEHLDFSAFKKLYLVNPDATILELEQQALNPTRGTGYIRMFAELNPLNLLTLSSLNYEEFGTYLTSDDKKSAPAICYVQLEFDANEYLENIEKNPIHPSPIHGVHPEKLRDAIVEIKNSNDEKKTKSLSLNASIDNISYKKIRHGIILSNKNSTILYGMPTLREIEDKHISFWKSL